MDSGISTVRNLLYIVLVLALLSIFANIYVGTQLSQNSDELARLGLLLQKQMMSTAMEQSQQLQKKMDSSIKTRPASTRSCKRPRTILWRG